MPEIDSERFVERYKELLPLLAGRIPEVARRAGVDVTRFMNATQRRIKSPELLCPMYEAMEEVAKKTIKEIKI